jgi:hypothetical protein
MSEFAMDEKQRLERASSTKYQFRSSWDEQPRARWHPASISYQNRTLRRLCIAICIVLATWTFTRSLLPHLVHSNNLGHEAIFSEPVRQSTSANDTRKVSLEAHIMSKCPDAKACLQNLVVPAMEKISDKVDFNLSFIGR